MGDGCFGCNNNMESSTQLKESHNSILNSLNDAPFVQISILLNLLLIFIYVMKKIQENSWVL